VASDCYLSTGHEAELDFEKKWISTSCEYDKLMEWLKTASGKGDLETLYDQESAEVKVVVV